MPHFPASFLFTRDGSGQLQAGESELVMTSWSSIEGIGKMPHQTDVAAFPEVPPLVIEESLCPH